MTPTAERFTTVGDVLDRLGGVEPGRVRVRPEPGTATEADLLALAGGTRRYELVDGVLVEKPMSEIASYLAGELLFLLRSFLALHDLGYLTPADGAKRLSAGLVRVPDVAFIRWSRLRTPGVIPDEAIASLAPDLAVEILSPSNTAGEMRRKVGDYLDAGVCLVWIIDPRARTCTVHQRGEAPRVLGVADTLDGGALLPGLAIPLSVLFTRLPAASPRRRRG